MCDQPCHECRKCDEPETCACGLEYSKQLAGGIMQAVCGHFVCDDCAITCEGCEVLVCPDCVVKRHGANYCGEVDCFPGSEEEND